MSKTCCTTCTWNMHQIIFFRLRMRALKQLRFSFYTFSVSIARYCGWSTVLFKSYYSVSAKYAQYQNYVYAACILNTPQIQKLSYDTNSGFKTPFLVLYISCINFNMWSQTVMWNIYIFQYICRISFFQLDESFMLCTRWWPQHQKKYINSFCKV